MRANTSAVGTPNNTFSGTTIATTNSDRFSAEMAAGVPTDAKNAPIPGLKVRQRINPTGTTTSTVT